MSPHSRSLQMPTRRKQLVLVRRSPAEVARIFKFLAGFIGIAAVIYAVFVLAFSL